MERLGGGHVNGEGVGLEKNNEMAHIFRYFNFLIQNHLRDVGRRGGGREGGVGPERAAGGLDRHGSPGGRRGRRRRASPSPAAVARRLARSKVQ